MAKVRILSKVITAGFRNIISLQLFSDWHYKNIILGILIIIIYEAFLKYFLQLFSGFN